MSISLNPLQEIGVGKHAGRAATTGSGLNPLQEIGVGKLEKMTALAAGLVLIPFRKSGWENYLNPGDVASAAS